MEGWASRAEGVVGLSGSGTGVWGQTQTGSGVLGTSVMGAGVRGYSANNEGLHAETDSLTFAAIAGISLNPSATGAAIYGRAVSNMGDAGFFDGNVRVTRTVTCDGDVCLKNADCAEEFTVANPVAATPGSVMVIGDDGDATVCTRGYDRRAVGVVSGGGAYKPALVLDQQGGEMRRAIALMGKVFCFVDAQFGAIAPGDLLTTSPTSGHAMKAWDSARMTGAIIGKALATLDTGRGMIPILVTLQ